MHAMHVYNISAWSDLYIPRNNAAPVWRCTLTQQGLMAHTLAKPFLPPEMACMQYVHAIRDRPLQAITAMQPLIHCTLSSHSLALEALLECASQIHSGSRLSTAA